MPTAPTGLTKAEDGGVTTLTWNHDGADLAKFEVMAREGATGVWRSVVMAPKADFGTGPYLVLVGSLPGEQWTVRAVAPNGGVST